MADSAPALQDGAQTVFFQAGGEWCYLRTPANYSNNGPVVPFVIQCHGSGGYVRDGAADWLEEDEKLVFLTALTDSGIAVAGSHGTGNHWGRPNAVAANAALFNTLTGLPGISGDRIGLWGGGLGGALLWNCVTGPLLGRVMAAVPQQAALSYESIIRDHQFKKPLLEAYDLPGDSPDDRAVWSLAYNDPLHRTRLLVAQRGAEAASLLPEVLFVWGEADDHMLLRGNGVALSNVLKSCGASFSFQTFPGVGHATYTLREKAAKPIADFFKRVFAL